MAADVGFWECKAVAQKMSTFASAKNRLDSRRYGTFVATFAYLPKNPRLAKSGT